MATRKQAFKRPPQKRLRFELLEQRLALSGLSPAAGAATVGPSVTSAALSAELVVSPAPPISAYETLNFYGTVATFTVSRANPQVQNFSVTVNWGDGTSNSTTIPPNAIVTVVPVVPGGSEFDVNASHRYAEVGIWRITVNVTDNVANYTDSDAFASETDLVTQSTDPNVTDPWGVAAGPTGPFYVANNGTGTVTEYTAAGTPQGSPITIPTPSGSGTASPTGIVFNNTSAFALASGTPATFIVATEQGALAAWNPYDGPAAELVVDNSGLGADYTGLATGSIGTGNYLYAANFASGQIDVFDSSFRQVSPASSPLVSNPFTDNVLIQHGFVPFNIQNLGGQLYVT